MGATKFHHIEDAVKAVELELTEDEIAYLEEPYVPHVLAGVTEVEMYDLIFLGQGSNDRVSDGELRETQTANYFSDIHPIDCAVPFVNA